MEVDARIAAEGSEREVMDLITRVTESIGERLQHVQVELDEIRSAKMRLLQITTLRDIRLGYSVITKGCDDGTSAG